MHTIELEGKGIPLVCLHGWGQSLEALKPLAELLTPVAKPILIDLPGFGQSKMPVNPWSAYDYADSIIRYLDMHQIERFSLMGHSFGGKVSLCLASRYPERVERMILLGSAGLKPKRTLKSQLRIQGIHFYGKAVKAYDQLRGTNHFCERFAPRYGSKDYKNAGPMRPILVKSVNEDLSPVLPKIQCPTLLLWGEKDQETPVEMGVRMSEMIPQSTLYRFPYHGHNLFEETGSHLLAKYIASYIKGEKG